MSNRARYIVEAIVLEHRSPSELARTHKVSRSWIYKMLERFEHGGYASLEPRSRRPRSCSHQVGAKVQELILKLRRDLTAAGHDAGPHTIHFHLSKKVSQPPSVATIWRILKRQGLVTPQPQKRPKSSFIRFVAKLPNETWQADATPWTLADGSPVEILNFLDDCSRVALASSCFRTVKGHDVAHVFHAAANTFGPPASLLTDNGAVFTGRQRRGKVILELELERLGIVSKHSTAYHPQTCGKVERHHQTLKRWLALQPAPATLDQLQALLDAYRDYYNTRRHHTAVKTTPQRAWDAAPALGGPGRLPRQDDATVHALTVRPNGTISLGGLDIYISTSRAGDKITAIRDHDRVTAYTPAGDPLGHIRLNHDKTYQGTITPAA
jgi:transposase InsO family protein